LIRRTTAFTAFVRAELLECSMTVSESEIIPDTGYDRDLAVIEKESPPSREIPEGAGRNPRAPAP
jgi:hypothetical protein